MAYGKILRKLRTQRNMTMQQVAHELHVPLSTYRDWEYGRRLPADIVPRLAQIFQTSISSIYGKPEQESNYRQELSEVKKALEVLVEKLSQVLN